MGVTQTILVRMKNNKLQGYACVLRVGDNIRQKECPSGSPEGRKERRRPEKKWGMEVERMT